MLLQCCTQPPAGMQHWERQACNTRKSAPPLPSAAHPCNTHTSTFHACFTGVHQSQQPPRPPATALARPSVTIAWDGASVGGLTGTTMAPAPLIGALDPSGSGWCCSAAPFASWSDPFTGAAPERQRHSRAGGPVDFLKWTFWSRAQVRPRFVPAAAAVQLNSHPEAHPAVVYHYLCRTRYQFHLLLALPACSNLEGSLTVGHHMGVLLHASSCLSLASPNALAARFGHLEL